MAVAIHYPKQIISIYRLFVILNLGDFTFFKGKTEFHFEHKLKLLKFNCKLNKKKGEKNMKTKTIIIALIFGLFVFLGCDKDSTGPSGDNISIFGIWTGHIDAEPNPYDETFIFTDDGQMFEYYINNQQTEGSFSSIYSITDTTLSLTVKAIWGNINTQVNDQTTVSYSINENQLIIEGFGSYTRVY